MITGEDMLNPVICSPPQTANLSKVDNGGVKADQDKLPLHLIPPELIFSLGKVLQFGANKYAERNWERGMSWSRVFSALQRHLWAWQAGEPCDQETGFSHLEHAACCIAFLVTYEQRGVGLDDR